MVCRSHFCFMNRDLNSPVFRRRRSGCSPSVQICTTFERKFELECSVAIAVPAHLIYCMHRMDGYCDTFTAVAVIGIAHVEQPRRKLTAANQTYFLLVKEHKQDVSGAVCNSKQLHHGAKNECNTRSVVICARRMLDCVVVRAQNNL